MILSNVQCSAIQRNFKFILSAEEYLVANLAAEHHASEAEEVGK